MALLPASSRSISTSMPRHNTCMNPGWPVMYYITYDKPNWDPEMELEYEVMPRDEFGVPAHIPPELSTSIRHTYYVPPQYYQFPKPLKVYRQRIPMPYRTAEEMKKSDEIMWEG